MKSGSKALRELFERPGIIRLAAAHNALTAKLVEKAGFDGVWSSGFEISTSYSLPDANILTMTEYLRAAASMCDTVSVPVVADVDTGYGNSSNVIDMVRRFEAAGVACVVIEDKQFPKVNSFIPGRQDLAPIGEFVGKLMAAKNTQRSADFMVVARVEALIAGWGMDEALRRAHTYVDAGADAILIHSKRSDPSEIKEFVKAWDNRAPVIVVPTTYFGITAKELQEMGVKMVIYANHGLRAAVSAVQDVLAQILRDDCTGGVEGRIASMKEIFALQGMPRFLREEALYLKTGRDSIRAVIPAAGSHQEVGSMKSLSAEGPVAMLDILGKPLVQRQIDVLNRCGVTDVSVVGGFHADSIVVDGANVVVNQRWGDTGNAESFFLGAEEEQDTPNPDGRTMMVFADILFDTDAVEAIQRASEDIVLLVDRTYVLAGEKENKKLDLVTLETPPPASRRVLNGSVPKKVMGIGKSIPAEDGHCEFIGLAMFSKKGLKAARDLYRELLAAGAPCGEAATAAKAGVTDVLQELIARGYDVTAIEVSSGWMEIHSFDDYRRACSLLAGRSE